MTAALKVLILLLLFSACSGLQYRKTIVLSWCSGQFDLSRSVEEAPECRGFPPVSFIFDSKYFKQINFTRACPEESTEEVQFTEGKEPTNLHNHIISWLDNLQKALVKMVVHTLAIRSITDQWLNIATYATAAISPVFLFIALTTRMWIENRLTNSNEAVTPQVP
jgi:hypothetical protein